MDIMILLNEVFGMFKNYGTKNEVSGIYVTKKKVSGMPIMRYLG
jgi:hypothetical protein